MSLGLIRTSCTHVCTISARTHGILLSCVVPHHNHLSLSTVEEKKGHFRIQAFTERLLLYYPIKVFKSNCNLQTFSQLHMHTGIFMGSLARI